jgi:Protein of unknown function (DUF1553)/Protein of unknown function (DUF1549)
MYPATTYSFHRTVHFLAIAWGLVWIWGTSVPVSAAVPSSPDARAKAVGQPVSLIVQPPVITLDGPRSMQQVVVSGTYADGKVRDLTPFCEFTLESHVGALDGTGFVIPRRNGSGALHAAVGGKTARIPLTVMHFDQPLPVSFRHELIAALNVGGCNQGSCHGTPSGKNGFKLSLRGFDPAADYLQLTRDVLGRRTDRLAPETSLILQKALGRVPHEGGLRFQPHSIAANVMRAWLVEGLRDDPPSLPALQKVEVLPGARVLSDPARWQQLAVIAHFADGTARDVTRLTVFSSSDPVVAMVEANGLVEFSQPGEIAILCRYLDEMVSVRLTYLEPRAGFAWTSPPENNFIDQHVFAKLKMLSILPSELCTDQEFLRRATMDLCGVLPTPEETRAFLASKDPERRTRLIDTLLERPEYADFWTLKWADVLRNNRKTIQAKGAYVFQHWLHEHIANNTPLDELVRELLTSSGSTFANPPANYYRVAKDPTSLAETTAQLFLGVRMQCAKCHNHPFERWSQDDYYGTAAFFVRVKQKKDPIEPGTKTTGARYVYVERSGEMIQPRKGQVMPPRFLGGEVPSIAPGADRRTVLAAWLTRPENPFFARSLVNRIWFHIMGRGIVDPVDDFRESNPSANDELLDALARDFVAHQFDAKHLIRTIMNSRTYQLSALPSAYNGDDNKYFSHAISKLYTAEQLFDALCFVTGVPEKFDGMPEGTRAMQLPDGEFNQPFLKTFGQPARELACECEREADSNLGQALQLINGPSINDRLRNPNNRIGKLLARKLSDRAVLDELYLVTLSRLPTDAEARPSLEHVRRAADRRKAWEDVQWALLNAKEFLFRH